MSLAKMHLTEALVVDNCSHFFLLLETSRGVPLEPDGIQLGDAFGRHMAHLFLLPWHDVVALLVYPVLPTLFEDPVCKGLILWVCRWHVTVAVLLFELLQLIQPRLPRRPADPDRPLEPQLVEILDPLLGQARLLSLLELAMLGTLAIDERAQGWIVTVFERNVDVAVMVLVLAEFLAPIFPRSVGFA